MFLFSNLFMTLLQTGHSLYKFSRSFPLDSLLIFSIMLRFSTSVIIILAELFKLKFWLVSFFNASFWFWETFMFAASFCGPSGREKHIPRLKSFGLELTGYGIFLFNDKSIGVLWSFLSLSFFSKPPKQSPCFPLFCDSAGLLKIFLNSCFFGGTTV